MAQFNPIKVSNPNILGSIQAGQQIGQQFRLGPLQIAAKEQSLEQSGVRFEQEQKDRETAQAEKKQASELVAAIEAGENEEVNFRALFKVNRSEAERLFAKKKAEVKSKRDAESKAIKDRFVSVTNAAVTAKNLPDDSSRIGFLTKRIGELNERGIDTSDTQEVLDLYNSGQSEQANSLINSAVQTGQQLGIIKAQSGQAKPAGLVQFESLTEGLTAKQKKEATLIQLGLSPRAVGSAIQTIAGAGLEEMIGDASATIKQREKFGELTGSSRAKTIDQGFAKINKINTGIGNIDRAVKLLNSGAGVGAIQKFLPSFRAASVELDNIQKSMALDVIGSVTFGALSQGELNLAKEVALPTGLSKDQLIDHLSRRKIAQEKLRGYYEEQIQFLDQGGTVAGFLRSKDRAVDQQPLQAQEQAAPPQQPAPTPAPQQADQGVIHIDANGNRAIVFADGSFKELP